MDVTLDLEKLREKRRLWAKEVASKITESGTTTSIGSINNYYGGLQVAALEGKYYWSIMDYCESIWEEIPFELYVNLVDFEEGRA